MTTPPQHDHAHHEAPADTGAQGHSCHSHNGHSHDGHSHGGAFDYLMWGSLAVVAVFYLLHWQFAALLAPFPSMEVFAQSVFDLMNTMWWGVVLGVVMIGLLSKVPREFVISALGRGDGITGLMRATLAGVLLDLCSHGILMVAAKLYERGASTGQVMAFLIASPWNSFSLTLVLIALIGLPWTIAFIVLSAAIALLTGIVFEALIRRGALPANPNQIDLPADFHFWREAKKRLSATTFSPALIGDMALNGLRDSRMVVRWLLFGVILAGLIRAFMDPAHFGTWFGPTLTGLGLTVLVATVLEVCSEGSAPIAADLLTRAAAPGNSFAFLMAGVATDYTEIMVLREATKSFRIALFLPLITVPQVLAISWLMNAFAAG